MVQEHHSYIIYTSTDVSLVMQDFIKCNNFQDVEVVTTELFGIDDSRTLVKKAYIQPSGANIKKLIVVKVENFTIEAQQSLLKILEEPPVSTVFLFIVPNSNLLISTLKSRFLEYETKYKDITSDNKSFPEFCTLSYKDRIALIVKKMEKNDSVWVKDIREGTSSWLLSSLKSLSAVQRQSLQTSILTLNTRGASNKMLLEEIALTLPITAEK